MKLLHVHQDELNAFIDALNEVFGSDGDLLTASYRKIHKYLGMKIDWTTEGMVVFTMYDYLEDILDEAPTDFDWEDVTPAVKELFTVNLTHQNWTHPRQFYSATLLLSSFALQRELDLASGSGIPEHTGQVIQCGGFEEAGWVDWYSIQKPQSIFH